MVFTQMHITNNTCNKTLLTILTLLKIPPLLYLEFMLKTVTIVTELSVTFLVTLTLTFREDVVSLSTLFKAAVSFTINIPIWDNSCLNWTTLSC